MKCFKHPDRDAVGVCSNCGKGICSECSRTTGKRIVCEECLIDPQKIKSSRLRQYYLISAALGWLGSINVSLIGGYTTLKLFYFGVMTGSQTEAYVVGILTAVLAVTLVLGGYWMWRGNSRNGGILNLAAGALTLIMFSYFTWSVPLMEEFGIAGPLLCIPAIISGTLGLTSAGFFKSNKI